ncbi:hypothetical protein P168DRAFT_327373 [Aspergillus campestris IBT 28561]|uniref:Protein ROT1 n=1 Tax=Aspergillus campestris (strain IBT 28561) TaxID=1392248 RepID=A0A2I1D3G9_ASPC2|nr:uncharacterized protein P168DRAFT_327373 [Aspergillus campestris IBT 28561]PKY04419.1 hypothetical protein P168DRAFT_327373 [Aspergillus campestris IBT 28561]
MLLGYLSVGLFLTTVGANNIAHLVGTWTTKSRKVITGPGFYDPINDELLEPDLPGISYSFTDDGHYETAYYRAIANPQDPSCPKGILQWQHGTFTMDKSGALHLTPFAVDGRQLLSDPCSSDHGEYTRYNQTEKFNSFKVAVDPYHKIQRLDLKSFDDSPMHPMYLVYRPPEMLPPMTLKAVGKRKRDVLRDGVSSPSLLTQGNLIDPNRWLWFGVFASALGGIALIYS